MCESVLMQWFQATSGFKRGDCPRAATVHVHVSMEVGSDAGQAAAGTSARTNWTFPDWAPGRHGRAGAWRDFESSDWPQPHKHDQVFRKLSIFVYKLTPTFTTLVWRKAESKMAAAMQRTNQGNCMLKYCHLGWDGGVDSREFTGAPGSGSVGALLRGEAFGFGNCLSLRAARCKARGAVAASPRAPLNRAQVRCP